MPWARFPARWLLSSPCPPGMSRLHRRALGDSGGLAGAAAQVKSLPADGAAAYDLDLLDDPRIKREDALDALAEADLRTVKLEPTPLLERGDAHALERLHAGAVALDHLDADAQGIAGAESWTGLSLSARQWLRARASRSVIGLYAFVSRRRAPEGGRLRAPPWRSIRCGRLSRVSSTASCRRPRDLRMIPDRSTSGIVRPPMSQAGIVRIFRRPCSKPPPLRWRPRPLTRGSSLTQASRRPRSELPPEST